MATEMQLFNQRDPKTFSEMHDKFFAPLFYFVNKRIKNEDEASEIVSDCFIKIYENKYQFEAIQQLKAWLYETAKNAAINFLRKDARENENSLSYALLQDANENMAQVEDEEFEYMDLMDKIYHEIQQHPPERRAVFELFYFQGKSAIEIASIKGINKSNVYDYKNKLLEALRKKFGQDVDKLFK
jgi:RNA polymerase sigma factor (sigma-70 family)